MEHSDANIQAAKAAADKVRSVRNRQYFRDAYKKWYTKNRQRLLDAKRESYAKNRQGKLHLKTQCCPSKQKAEVVLDNAPLIEHREGLPCITQLTSCKRNYALNKNRILQRKSTARRVGNILLKKSKRIIQRYNCMKLKSSLEVYTRALALKFGNNVDARLAAERIIKWVAHKRTFWVKSSKTLLTKCKLKAEVMLTRFDECRCTASSEQLTALCGISEHSSTSEPYFYDCTYKLNDIPTMAIPINEQGQAPEMFPPAQRRKRKRCSSKFWSCSDETCNLDSSIIIKRMTNFLKCLSCTQPRNLVAFAKSLDTCKSDVQFSTQKMGHPLVCHMTLSSCTSCLLFLRIIGPHFPEVRDLLKSLYNLRKCTLQIGAIDEALKATNVAELASLAESAEKEAREFAGDADRDCMFESDIHEKYKSGYRAFTKRSVDLPVHDCISCEKLCFAREVSDLRRLRRPLTGEPWENLQTHNAKFTEKAECHMICKYCLGKFRNNEMPPTCILNGLLVHPVPLEISQLNTFELPLVQRARCFQTIQRMGTVSNKCIPHREKVLKAIGRSFHLPLPTEETLKKLPLPKDPVNKNPDTYILVRSVPNKTNVVWEDLVNVDHVYAALVKLKNINYLYKDIELPDKAIHLLNGVEPQVLFVADDLEDSQDVDDPEPLVSQEIQALLNEPLAKIALNNNKHVGDIVEPDGLQCSGKPAMTGEAMLTLVDPETSEFDYQEYTIHPMYESKDTRSALALYQMLKVNQAPLDYHDKLIDVKCFPDLFTEGLYGQFHPRNFALTSAAFIKCKLKSKHGRFRRSIQYIFYLLNDANRRQLAQGIYQQMKIVNPREKLTASQCLALMCTEEFEKNLNTIFSHLRNTEPFWTRPRNNLKCMTTAYGPATWFLTLSPSEFDWLDLGEFLRDINGPSMAGKSVSELVALDPVSASRFIDNKFRATLDFLTSDAEPLGKITHYFWRREYQGRGLQHFHLLLWVENAPIMGVATPEEVANFIMKYVTCQKPNKDQCPTLHDRVMRYQVHKDNSYCLRTKKTKMGNVRVCRFGFPRRTTDVFVLHDVATSIAGRKSMSKKCRLYELVRKPDEVRINDYSAAVMLAWIGNMDLQYIGEKSAVLNAYVTKYATKPEKGHMRETFDMISSTKSLCSRLYNVGLRSLSNRECGALEAADTLLGIPLYGVDPDTTFVWIDCNQVRARRLKSMQHVKSLDPDSTDLFYESMVDDHYPNRPEALQELSLYEFVAWYDIVKAMPTGEMDEGYQLANGRYLKKRKRAHLVNHYRYNPQLLPEKYYYSILLMFKPWREEEELKGHYDTFTDAFNASKDDLVEANRYNSHLQELQAAAESVEEQVEAQLCKAATEAQSMDCDESTINPLGSVVQVEATAAMEEFRAAAEMSLEPEDVSNLVEQLNADQRRVFDKVVQSVQNRKDSDEVLRHYVSGVGGSGKSFLIHVLKSWLKIHLKLDTAIGAPTGLSAFNVSGMTIFRLLQLPVEHGDNMPTYRELSSAALKALRDELKNVGLFIIDEISMISNVTLMYIHLRLSEVFNTKDAPNGFFGRIPMVFFGDLLQLPPVHDLPPFLKLTREQVDKYLGSLSVVNLWRDLFTYDELKINMRQLDDAPFVDLLHRIRIGVVTRRDCELLNSRKVVLAAESLHERLCELATLITKLPSETVCLLPTRQQCSALNEAMLKQIPSEEILLVAVDKLDCLRNAQHLRKRAQIWLKKYEDDCSRTAGLEKTIVIKVNAKVMLRRNIDVTIGLVNGALATVVSVKRSIDNLKVVQSVRLRFASGLVKDIERVDSRFEVLTGAYVYRKQFPISVSYALSIHKAQGLSLPSAILDIGTSVFSCGQIYVALSRVTKLEGLHLINFNPSDIKALPSAILEYNRLNKVYFPNSAEIPIIRKQAAKRQVQDTVWAPCAKALQIQSTAAPAKRPKQVPIPIPGFVNSDGASCYANATLQCILHIEQLRKELENQSVQDALKDLAATFPYATTAVDAMSVRQLVDNSLGNGDKFVMPEQQDASEFLMALIQTSEEIMNQTRFCEHWEKRCCNCGISNISGGISSNMLHIDLPGSEKERNTNFQSLINRAFAWETIKCVCEQCSSGPIERRLSIRSLSPLLVLHLKMFEFTNNVSMKITNLKVSEVPSTTLTLDGHMYQTVCGISHLGTELDRGHYVAYLRQARSWLCADDNEVSQSKWPYNAKNIMILILQKKN